MPKRKLTKEIEIIEPGQITQLLDTVKTFVIEHINQVAAIALIIVVVSGSIGLWKYNQVQADQQSLSLFYAALQNYNTIQAVSEKQGTSAPTEDFYKKALEQFTNVIKQYPDSRGGVASLFYAGSCSYYLKKDDEALRYYQDFLNKIGQRDDALRPFAYEGMGYVYERKEDYKKAIEWFDKQKNDKLKSLTMTAPLNLARCYAALGERDNACKAYQEFISKYPSSALADTAKIGETAYCQMVRK